MSLNDSNSFGDDPGILSFLWKKIEQHAAHTLRERYLNFDGFVKSRELNFFVIPAEAGIQRRRRPKKRPVWSKKKLNGTGIFFWQDQQDEQDIV